MCAPNQRNGGASAKHITPVIMPRYPVCPTIMAPATKAKKPKKVPRIAAKLNSSQNISR
jgi:hypothetical protein